MNQRVIFTIEKVSMNRCKSIGEKNFTRKLLKYIVDDKNIHGNELENNSLRFYKIFHYILQNMLNETYEQVIQHET